MDGNNIKVRPARLERQAHGFGQGMASRGGEREARGVGHSAATLA